RDEAPTVGRFGETVPNGEAAEGERVEVGVVERVGDDAISLRRADDSVVKLDVSPRTEIVRSGVPVAIEAIPEGAQVRATYAGDEATRIEVLSAFKPDKQGPGSDTGTMVPAERERLPPRPGVR